MKHQSYCAERFQQSTSYIQTCQILWEKITKTAALKLLWSINLTAFHCTTLKMYISYIHLSQQRCDCGDKCSAVCAFSRINILMYIILRFSDSTTGHHTCVYVTLKCSTMTSVRRLLHDHQLHQCLRHFPNTPTYAHCEKTRSGDKILETLRATLSL